MKEAHLRYPAADLDETIYRPERQLDTQTIERLSTCHWIEEGKNLIVTGSSASGKTYLINAFCVTAMKQSKSVKYIKSEHSYERNGTGTYQIHKSGLPE